MDKPNTAKPPNILIHSSDSATLENVKKLTKSIVHEDMYTIYDLPTEEAKKAHWIDQATLVIICKDVENEVKTQIKEYLLCGGKLLALCSNFIEILNENCGTKIGLPLGNKIAKFSYEEWKNVELLSDVSDFSISFGENETSKVVLSKVPKNPDLKVKSLANDEIEKNTLIIYAEMPETGAKIIFSQIHLESDPQNCENTVKREILERNDSARIEIFRDIMSSQFGILTSEKPKSINYTIGHLLGMEKNKMEFLEQIRGKMKGEILKNSKLEMQFFENEGEIKKASEKFLPISSYEEPVNFSKDEYFEHLKTKSLGRLLLYTDVMASSMNVTMENMFPHGFAVITDRMTRGVGRTNNAWLSPEGSAPFTLQMHFSRSSLLGSRISLIQCLTSLAIVNAVRGQPGYEDVDLRIKWPNDIYLGKTKIGGMIVQCLVESSSIICNLGAGINLSNKKPTVCLNDELKSGNLGTFSHERYYASVFNEIERWVDIVQEGDFDLFYATYYAYWLHSGSMVNVTLQDGTSKNVTIVGIDDHGFLKVKDNEEKSFSVHPDGNSFDILKGLIIPK